ncbi:MAG: adenylate/guanylate cyclase domain-containing protein [Proteobacteria bacterium]|nr:adenylate/guanylate cyclase domain-containing protein [Pseudomonadota bacterium]
MQKLDTEAIADHLIDWFLSEARLIEDNEKLDQSIVDQLLAVGLPMSRFTTGVPSLHPQVDSFSTLWEEGKGLIFRKFKVENLGTADPSNNAMLSVYAKGETVRCELESPPKEGEYPLLAEFRADGYTDYIVVPLPFSDGSNKAVSYATHRLGGFTDDEIAIMVKIRHALAAVLEVRTLRHLAGTLMDTYVGPVAGRRVLTGDIKRGTGEAIRAAIWFCDLKGFTAASETLESHALMDLLNAYFDTVTDAIEAHEGEILKFIGDAVLAIFPAEEGQEASAVDHALQAALTACASIGDVNEVRRTQNKLEIDCGIALHFGTVFYGNVGGKNRLDFTVIGPSVNLASRIESLTRELGEDILISEDFATRHSAEFVSKGEFSLKGIETPQSVYAIAVPLDQSNG